MAGDEAGEEELKRPEMIRRATLGLLAGALLLVSCSTADVRTDVVRSLERYAALLGQMNRPNEATEIEARASKLRQAMHTGPGADLGFNPSATLSEYAAMLQKRGQEDDAKEIEALAEAYHHANLEAFQRLVLQRSQAAQLLEDRLIVPGERIGWLRLESKLEEVTRILGEGIKRGVGLREESTVYTWDPIGLWLIADNATGKILWISVEMAGSNPWFELSTREGLRLGSTEEQVLAVMGQPSRTVADAFAKSLYFDRQGIRFTVLVSGRLAGKVAALRILRPRSLLP